MRSLAFSGSQDIDVRTQAMRVTQGALQKDYRTEACLCLAFCRDQIRYVRDIRSVEVLQMPVWTLKLGAGDCDDKSMLLAAMLASIGYRVRFIAVAFAPEQFSHVWVQAWVGNNWLDLEPTEPLSCGERIPSQGAYEYLTCEL
jgi:hypothetical protein